VNGRQREGKEMTRKKPEEVKEAARRGQGGANEKAMEHETFSSTHGNPIIPKCQSPLSHKQSVANLLFNATRNTTHSA
jgi:hypothetical protein